MQNNAPERVWISPEERGTNDAQVWDEAARGLFPEYVRADLFDALTAERDALRAAAEPFTQVVELADAGEIEGLHWADRFGLWLHGDDDAPVWCASIVTFEQIGKLHHALNSSTPPDETAV